MTYIEWCDELKKNLLCVSDAERRRVMDYYAEAYADRREAGFSEKEIIEEFGAPYDAAQRILSDNRTEPADEPEPLPEETGKREKKREERERKKEQTAYTPPPEYGAPPQGAPAPAYVPPEYGKTDNRWLFVIICILLAGPIFGALMTIVGITIGFCVAPVVIIGSGAAIVGSAVGTMVGGNIAYGLVSLGFGIVVIGIGVILCPLFFKLVSLMWKLFKNFFRWLKSQFGIKERVK